MDKDTKIDIGIGIFWAAICGVVASMFWGRVLQITLYLLFKIEWGYPAGILLVLVINICHFIFGWFHADENVGDLASNDPVLMQSVFLLDRIYVRILAVISIGLSLYVQHALLAYRCYKKDQEEET
jgi:hypothetical protein